MPILHQLLRLPDRGAGAHPRLMPGCLHRCYATRVLQHRTGGVLHIASPTASATHAATLAATLAAATLAAVAAASKAPSSFTPATAVASPCPACLRALRLRWLLRLAVLHNHPAPRGAAAQPPLPVPGRRHKVSGPSPAHSLHTHATSPVLLHSLSIAGACSITWTCASMCTHAHASTACTNRTPPPPPPPPPLRCTFVHLRPPRPPLQPHLHLCCTPSLHAHSVYRRRLVCTPPHLLSPSLLACKSSSPSLLLP